MVLLKRSRTWPTLESSGTNAIPVDIVLSRKKNIFIEGKKGATLSQSKRSKDKTLGKCSVLSESSAFLCTIKMQPGLKVTFSQLDQTGTKLWAPSVIGYIYCRGKSALWKRTFRCNIVMGNWCFFLWTEEDQSQRNESWVCYYISRFLSTNIYILLLHE